MTLENTQKAETNESNVIDDLALEEIKTEAIKGGAVDQFVKITDVKGESREIK